MTLLSDQASHPSVSGAPEGFRFVAPSAFSEIGGSPLGWEIHVQTPFAPTDPYYPQTQTLRNRLVARTLPFEVSEAVHGMEIYPRNPDEVAEIERVVRTLTLRQMAALQQRRGLRLCDGVTARFSTKHLTSKAFEIFDPPDESGIGVLKRDLFFIDARGAFVTMAADSCESVEARAVLAHKAHLALFGSFYLSEGMADALHEQLPPLSRAEENFCRSLIPLAVCECGGASGVRDFPQLTRRDDVRVLLPHMMSVMEMGALPCLTAAFRRSPAIQASELVDRLSEWCLLTTSDSSVEATL